ERDAECARRCFEMMTSRGPAAVRVRLRAGTCVERFPRLRAARIVRRAPRLLSADAYQCLPMPTNAYQSSPHPRRMLRDVDQCRRMLTLGRGPAPAGSRCEDADALGRRAPSAF